MKVLKYKKEDPNQLSSSKLLMQTVICMKTWSSRMKLKPIWLVIDLEPMEKITQAKLKIR